MTKAWMFLVAVAISGMLVAGGVAAEKSETAAKPINTKCPMSGKDVDATQTSTHEGTVVAFCCGNCKKKFDTDPAKYVKNVKGKPINTVCPISGEAADAEVVSVYQNKAVAFCCKKCKGKFDENPAEHIKKVKVAEAK